MTNLDYALMMLEIYEQDDPLNFDAILHYKELAEQELVDVPEGLPAELEARGWLHATKGILDFWDNDEDEQLAEQERERMRRDG